MDFATFSQFFDDKMFQFDKMTITTLTKYSTQTRCVQ